MVFILSDKVSKLVRSCLESAPLLYKALATALPGSGSAPLQPYEIIIPAFRSSFVLRCTYFYCSVSRSPPLFGLPDFGSAPGPSALAAAGISLPSRRSTLSPSRKDARQQGRSPGT